jgi:hypothetical protein
MMNDLFVLVFNFVSPLTNAVRQKQKRQKAEEKNFLPHPHVFQKVSAKITKRKES